MATTEKKANKGTGTIDATKTKKAATVATTKVIPALDKKNKDEVKKEITDKKDLLYIYPKGCGDLAPRKKFRHKVRAAIEQFEKAIEKLEEKGDKKALKEKQAEYAEYRKTVMVKP